MTIKTIQRRATLSEMVAAHNRANKTKLTVDQVAKANGLKDPNKIIAGGKLLFPDAFETKAPQSTVRGADNQPLVRNGVKEQMNIENTTAPTPIETPVAKVSTEITPRPLEPLPTRKQDSFQAKPQPKQPPQQPVTTTEAKLSTAVTPRPLEPLPQAPVKTEPAVAKTPEKPQATVTQATVTPKPSEPTLLPLPPEFRGSGGSDKRMESILEQGFTKGGYRQELAWLQESQGIKVDGKFGPGTAKALEQFPKIIDTLRADRIAETKGRTNMAPLTTAARDRLKNEIAAAYDRTLAKGDAKNDPLAWEKAREAAVKVLQTKLTLGNEPLSIDGKLGKQTYESMVRLYGKRTADQLSTFITEAVTSRGVD